MPKRSKSRKGYSKKQNERYHFKTQMLTRYGIELLGDDVREIISTITGRSTGKINKHKITSEFVEKKSNSRSLYKVVYDDQVMLVIYDNSRHELVTALPKDAYENYKMENKNIGG